MGTLNQPRCASPSERSGALAHPDAVSVPGCHRSRLNRFLRVRVWLLAQAGEARDEPILQAAAHTWGRGSQLGMQTCSPHGNDVPTYANTTRARSRPRGKLPGRSCGYWCSHFTWRNWNQ